MAVKRDAGMPPGARRPGGRDGEGRRRGRQRAAAAPASTPTAGCVNADDCVGEIVNTAGAGPFEGYYGNHEANARDPAQRLVLVGRPRLRDDDGWLYFAGRTADWIRVDGENFPAGPIERRPVAPPRRRAGRGLRRARRRTPATR